MSTRRLAVAEHKPLVKALEPKRHRYGLYECCEAAASRFPGTLRSPKRRTRILEKQNSLQMSQVFFGIAHSSLARFAFQGFYMRDHGTRQRYRLSPRPVNARVNQEPTRYAENAQAMTQTFNEFWSRCSEAASARQRSSQCHHDTLRSRRSEARPR